LKDLTIKKQHQIEKDKVNLTVVAHRHFFATRRTREDRWRKEREGHRRKPEEHRNFSSVNNFSTFFFSNFPGGFGEYDMLKIFQKWARVKEVFISKRLNRWEEDSVS